MLEGTTILLSKVPDWVSEHAGFKPNRSTVFRWKTRGCRGKKLATFRVGGRVCTNVESLLEFFRDDNDEPLTVDQDSVTDSEAYLASEGL